MSEARITWCSGSVLRARPEGSFQVNEALLVGPKQLLGEVIRLSHDEIVAQVYEDTGGLRPGHRVTGQHMPLSAPLGPGLLGNVLDGLLRPLSALETDLIWPGVRPHEGGTFHFVPAVRAGQQLGPGAPFGHVEPRPGTTLPCLTTSLSLTPIDSPSLCVITMQPGSRSSQLNSNSCGCVRAVIWLPAVGLCE